MGRCRVQDEKPDVESKPLFPLSKRFLFFDVGNVGFSYNVGVTLTACPVCGVEGPKEDPRVEAIAGVPCRLGLLRATGRTPRGRARRS